MGAIAPNESRGLGPVGWRSTSYANGRAASKGIAVAEFIEACTQSPVNLALSVLLGLILLYWVIVCLGAVGIDSLDFDFDMDGEPDFDLDANGSLLHAGMSTSVMRFFHIGTVPLLVLLSVFVLAMWALGVISYRWIGHWSVLLQLAMLVPFALGALVLTKVLTLPLAALFKKMREQEDAEQHVDLIGRRCRVVSLTADHRHGQVEVATEGAPLRLNVTTADESIVLNKGDEAVLITQDKARGVYHVRGF